MGHFQPFRSRHLASVRNCIQTRMWRRRGMISSWENPHYLKVNAVAHYSSSDQCPATTYARPAFAVDEPNHSAARVRSIEPPPTGLHPPTAPARLFRPCSCASIDHDATAGPPSLLAGCGGGSWLLLRRQNSSELRKHIQRPPSSCAKAVASAAAFLSGQLSVPPPIGFATQLLEDSRSLNFYGCFCHQQHRSLFEARGGGAAYNLARGQEKRSSC